MGVEIKDLTLVQRIEALEELKHKMRSGASDEDLENLDGLVVSISDAAAKAAAKAQRVLRPAIGGGPPDSRSHETLWQRHTPLRVVIKSYGQEMSIPIEPNIYNPEADGVALNGHWPKFFRFLQDVWEATRTGIVGAGLKALGESDGAAGGFLVPEEFRAQLLMVALEQAVVRPRATVFPMARLEQRIPAIHDVSHATNVYGGVQVYIVGESSTVTETAPTFKQILFTAKKVMGDTAVGNELLQDSPIALEALLTMMFGTAMAWWEDEWFINGTGGGQPLGILNSPALVSVAKEAGQVAQTIVVQNIDKMWARLLPQCESRAIWMANRDTIPQLMSLTRDVGTGGAPVMMVNVAGPGPQTMYGRPIIYTEHCQTLGTVGDLYLVDFTYYLICDRQQFSVDSSPHVRFRNDETVWKFIERFDAKPWLESAITPRYSTDTLSPFVALATRA